MAYKRSRYGLATLRNLEYRLRKFREILDKELFEIVHMHENEITQYIKEQLWNSIDGFNQAIQPPYASRTIKNKIKKNQPTDRVTLKDTGKFYKSFEVNTENRDGFAIVSTDIKLDKLREKYGDAILRLTRQSFNEILKKYIRPELHDRMKEYLLKK